MTTVAEQITWDSNKAALKAHLGLNGSTSEDAKLQLWLEAAIRKADEYLGRDFVVNRARWVIGPTVESGYVYTLKVTPEDESALVEFSASYTASSGDSAQKAAYELRKELDIALASREVTVSGAGAAIEAAMDDPTAALEASSTKSGTSATITQTLFYDGVPSDVVFGCYEFVKALRKIAYRSPGVKSVKTASLAESYDDGDAAKHAFAAAKPWWSNYKAEPLLDGRN